MKIVCDTTTLSAACQNIQRSVSNKGTTLPSLECILLDAAEDGVSLTGYDLETGSETFIKGFVEEKGRTAINARHLCDILRFLPDSRVTIESDEKDMCRITSGEAEYSIIGTPADTYPDLPSVTGETPIIINQEILRDMIRKTIYAVAIGEARPVHTGVKFEIESGRISLIALDGFRLAIRRENIEYSGEPQAFVVPAKTLNELMKYSDSDDGNITITVGKRHIVFEVCGYKIISRLLDGEFLDYKAAIPAVSNTTITINTKELIECVERTSLLVSTEKIKTPVRCVADGKEVRFSNVTSLGKAKDKCGAQIEGKGIEIGFNARFMLDALKVCDEEYVNIELNTSATPIIITPTDKDNFLFLILPMRLKNENEI